MNSFRACLALALLGVMLSSLIACGDDDRTATGSGGSGGMGGSCDPAAPSLIWGSCYDDFECTTVPVPLSYDDPCGRTLDLAVIRARAKGERRGTLFFSEGGPGASSVDWVVQFYGAAVAVLPQTAQHFDLVAVDWRGVGASAPLSCDLSAANDAFRALPFRPTTDAEQAEYESVFEMGRHPCTDSFDGALLGNVATEDAARDLDMVRAALGDDRISFVGWSYGGYLGQVYMSLFPEHVAGFVLDSPASPDADLTLDLTTWATELERKYEEFFLWCGDPASSECAFHQGEGAASVQAALEALLDDIEATGGLPVGERRLSRMDAGEGIYGRLAEGMFAAVSADLAAVEAGDGAPLLAKADESWGDGSDADRQAIFCLDRSAKLDIERDAFWAFVDELEAGPAPHVAREIATGWGVCRAWPSQRTPVTVGAPSAPPALVIVGPDDVWAPRSFAESTIDALANGSHLLLSEASGHVQLTRSACVQAVVDDFLVDPSTPPATTDCSEP